MKSRLAIALAAGLAGATLALASSAHAMPVSLIAAPNDLVTQVAGGCGKGWHRGPHGGCRKNYANPAAHPCPRAGISAGSAAAGPTALELNSVLT